MTPKAYVTTSKDEDGWYTIELTVDGYEKDIAYTQCENEKNKIESQFNRKAEDELK